MNEERVSSTSEEETRLVAKAPPHQMLSLPSPLLRRLSAEPSVREIKELLTLVKDTVEVVQIEDHGKLLRRIRGDLTFITRYIAAEEVLQASKDTDEPISQVHHGTVVKKHKRLPRLSAPKVQGMINNIRGFQGEIIAALMAPGVIGMDKRFYYSVSKSLPSTISSSGDKASGQSGITFSYPRRTQTFFQAF
jgi:hypothetical protein